MYRNRDGVTVMGEPVRLACGSQDGRSERECDNRTRSPSGRARDAPAGSPRTFDLAWLVQRSTTSP